MYRMNTMQRVAAVLGLNIDSSREEINAVLHSIDMRYADDRWYALQVSKLESRLEERLDNIRRQEDSESLRIRTFKPGNDMFDHFWRMDKYDELAEKVDAAKDKVMAAHEAAKKDLEAKRDIAMKLQRIMMTQR